MFTFWSSEKQDNNFRPHRFVYCSHQISFIIIIIIIIIITNITK